MCHQNRLYRYGVFEPIVEIGQHVRLIGPSAAPFFRVQYVEPIPFIESGANRPGILVRDFNANNLANGAAFDIQPTELQMPTNELLQLRFTFFEVASGAGLISVLGNLNLLNIQVSQLAASARWVTLSARGIVSGALLEPLVSPENATFSFANAPTGTTNINRLSRLPWGELNQTELFVYQLDAPTFTVVNRLGVALTQGVLRLAVSAFRFILTPVAEDLDATNRPYTWVPVQGRGSSGSPRG